MREYEFDFLLTIFRAVANIRFKRRFKVCKTIRRIVETFNRFGKFGCVEFRKVILEFAKRFTRVAECVYVACRLIGDRVFNEIVYTIAFFPFNERFAVFRSPDFLRKILRLRLLPIV